MTKPYLTRTPHPAKVIPLHSLGNKIPVAGSFEGVQKTFALQAGREIRIIVESQKVSDDRASLIARDIAAKIKNELDYPGQIKVTVIRETRASAVAR